MTQKKHVFSALIASAIGLLGITYAMSAMGDKPVPDSTLQPTTDNAQSATIGGGCFWCIEAVFDHIDGIHATISGYAGGDTPDPSYEAVCSGLTGHAEVVQVTFDPNLISYGEVLDIFMAAHNPTTLNQQGADKGTQYRSIILYKDETQKQEAQAALKRAQKKYKDPIVTELSPLDTFYEAEPYHQNYFTRNPDIPYSKYVIEPKLKKMGLD